MGPGKGQMGCTSQGAVRRWKEVVLTRRRAGWQQVARELEPPVMALAVLPIGNEYP